MIGSLTLGIVFIILLLMGVPLGFSLGMASIIALLIKGAMPMEVVPQMLFSGANNYLLTAVPLFMLAGSLMSKGGISERIFNFARALVGWMTGGIGHVNVVASLLFGGISGSSTSDVAALGPIEIEAMTANGYPKTYATALTITTAPLASLIPPSIGLVIYGYVAGQSVGKLFVGGIGPGIMYGLILMMVNYFLSKKYNWGTKTKFTFANIWETGIRAILPMLTPIIVVGGILTGIVTPTEAATLAVIWTLFLSIVIEKSIKVKDIPKIILESGKVSAIALFVILPSVLSSWILAYEKVPIYLANWLVEVSNTQTIFIFLVGIILLIMGMFIGTSILILIVSPLLVPVAIQLGMDPIHFGIVMMAWCGIGLFTPPVGNCLYVGSAVSQLPVEKIVGKEYLILLFASIVATLIIAFYPPITMFLVELLF
ncbi:MAG: TRAP transporter large permease [Eubacteriales bacterium]